MTRKHTLTVWLLLFFVACVIAVPSARAQENKLSITIVPPLYQITIAPGTEWKSTLRVVNTNPYPLVIHAQVTDFHQDGETGSAVFDNLSSGEPDDTTRISGWITIPETEITVAPDGSYEIPITITVPFGADPGGHYGAIMVGTNPSGAVSGGSGAAIGTMLSSLIFLRVPGEVVEEGMIRDFYTEHTMMASPDQVFTLRFENRGNVHLVPQGHIVIRNMWGKERGEIVVNEKSSFGNVLPKSTRKFSFEWHGTPSILDIGRYEAEAVLSFGENNKQSAVRVTYFWIIPWKQVSGVLGTIIFLAWFFTWAIRRYVRKAIEMERSRSGIGEHEEREKGSAVIAGEQTPARLNAHKIQPKITLAVLKQPIIQGAIDLSGKSTHRSVPASDNRTNEPMGGPHPIVAWVRQYRFFLLFVFMFIIAISLIGWYFVEVFQDERAYKIQEIRGQ